MAWAATTMTKVHDELAVIAVVVAAAAAVVVVLALTSFGLDS